MPLSAPAAACLKASFTSSLLVSLRSVATKSTTETVTVGTRSDMPSKRPLSSGITRASARAAQVAVHLVENALVVGIGVDGIHQAFFNAKGIIDNFGGGGQAIGGAGSI